MKKLMVPALLFVVSISLAGCFFPGGRYGGGGYDGGGYGHPPPPPGYGGGYGHPQGPPPGPGYGGGYHQQP
jgi:hypothetical protein